MQCSINKKIFVAIFISSLLVSCFSDIPYVGYDEGPFLGNIEGILCYVANGSGKYTNMLIWVGYAFVYPFLGTEIAHGAETALEIRRYLRFGPRSSGLFAAAYCGAGAMNLPNYYRGDAAGKSWTLGASAGGKIGYKYSVNEIARPNSLTIFSIEPYGSISGSVFIEGSADNPLYSIGMRFVLEHCTSRLEK